MREKRGRIMGLWSTCYQVGGIAATAFATWLLVHYGWRTAFLGPAACTSHGIASPSVRPGR